ncbi:ionotropic receptor 21a-like isoform X2 [Macrobrachium rosenbergii]|uniref:ionotropic receptor 21a-like isoform X2 n=1 Tax=Macrobrachium rosenbergii TaxID=79674 RepID=UPI0034D69D30
MILRVESLLLIIIQVVVATTTREISLNSLSQRIALMKYNRDRETILLFEEIARHFTPTCLKILVGDTPNYSSTWNDPLVLLHSSGNETEKAVSFINKNTEKMTNYPCMIYMITHNPSVTLMSEMLDLNDKVITRYFFVSTPSQRQAHAFLLDKKLANEENLAAVVKLRNSTHSWNVFTRQLLHPSGVPTVIHANVWNPERGFKKEKDMFPEQMGNFYGKTLKGVTLDFQPFTDYRIIKGSKKVEPSPSLDVFILNMIARHLNFTYELVMPDDGLWGTLDASKGHWSGVVGDVQFHRADFSLCLSVTQERRRSVDFTRVYFMDPLSFVTAKNRPQPPWLKLITPFTDSVWILTVILVVLTVFLYYFVFFIQSFLGPHKIRLSSAFMYVVGSFLGQALILPQLTAGQVLLGFWFIYGFLLTTYYKTALTATLAVPSVPPTIDTLAQLLNSDLKYGMIDAKGSEYQLFSTSNVTLYMELFKHMTFYSSDESMRRVAAGSYAYIYFRSNLQTIVNTQFTTKNGETNLHISSEEFFPGGYGWAFPKGAPYRRTFDNVMLRCLQAGLIAKWLKDLYRIYLAEHHLMMTPEEAKRADEISSTDSNEVLVVLNLYHFQGAFFAMFFGFGFGLILLGVEVVMWKVVASPETSF